jgi:hypothetical protein
VKQLESLSSSKVQQFHLRKTKVLLFNQQNVSNQSPWIIFVLKLSISTWEPNSF